MQFITIMMKLSAEVMILVLMTVSGYGQLISVPHTSDFGEIVIGDEKHNEINIHNSSGREISIKQIKPSCSCVNAKGSQSEVKAGGDIKIEVTVRGTEKPGFSNEAIGILWCYADSKDIELSLFPFTFTSVALLRVFPAAIDFGVLYNKDRPVRSVECSRINKSSEWDDIKVSASSYFSVELDESDKTRWGINVRPAEYLPAGKIQGSCEIMFYKQGRKLRYRYIIPISATACNSAIILNRESIYCGVVELEKEIQMDVEISGTGAKDLTATSPISQLIVNDEGYSDASKSRKLSIRLKSSGKLGPFNGEILIKTADGNSKISIPISAYFETRS